MIRILSPCGISILVLITGIEKTRILSLYGVSILASLTIGIEKTKILSLCVVSILALIAGKKRNLDKTRILSL